MRQAGHAIWRWVTLLVEHAVEDAGGMQLMPWWSRSGKTSIWVSILTMFLSWRRNFLPGLPTRHWRQDSTPQMVCQNTCHLNGLSTKSFTVLQLFDKNKSQNNLLRSNLSEKLVILSLYAKPMDMDDWARCAQSDWIQVKTALFLNGPKANGPTPKWPQPKWPNSETAPTETAPGNHGSTALTPKRPP